MSASVATSAQWAAHYASLRRASDSLLGRSWMERLAALPDAAREAIMAEVGALDAHRLLYDWSMWARPKQRAPAGDWDVWFLNCGRGFGKSRTGAEWIRARVETGQARSIALVGPNLDHIRRWMVGGDKGKSRNGSGLLDICPPWNRPRWLEEKGELRWPGPDGAVAYACSADTPELRGPNLDTVWGDEPIEWRAGEALWQNIGLTLREPGGARPQIVVTSTPKPLALIRQIILEPGCVVTMGSSDENASNVAASWLERQHRTLDGTRQGEQELHAGWLGENPGSMFSIGTIDRHRVRDAPAFERVVVGVDPAASRKRWSDRTGIVAAGIYRGELYPIEDATAKLTPEQWGQRAVEMAYRLSASVVVERNKVGDLAAANIRSSEREFRAARGITGPTLTIVDVLADGDKPTRHTPLSTAYQRGGVHHVGRLARLEDEMAEWDPGRSDSPDGLDALGHVAQELCPQWWAREPAVSAESAFRGLQQANAGFAHGGRFGGREAPL